MCIIQIDFKPGIVMVIDMYQKKIKKFHYSFILGNIINSWFKVI